MGVSSGPHPLMRGDPSSPSLQARCAWRVALLTGFGGARDEEERTLRGRRGNTAVRFQRTLWTSNFSMILVFRSPANPSFPTARSLCSIWWPKKAMCVSVMRARGSGH
ncbi:hypothetical protein BS78_04G220600 [Paspalum vaginatum]|nr:hypothetical protein BS78_04G220600 [Paspalum vaginatum]